MPAVERRLLAKVTIDTDPSVKDPGDAERSAAAISCGQGTRSDLIRTLGRSNAMWEPADADRRTWSRNWSPIRLNPAELFGANRFP